MNRFQASRNLLCAGLLSLAASAQADGSERIRVNQFGYAANQPKIAILRDDVSSANLVDASTNDVVWTGTPAEAIVWVNAGDPIDTASVLDFTGFTTPGTYYLTAGGETSHPIVISANPYLSLSRGAIKAFWYNRSGYALPAEYAGDWAREAGHPDISVIVHKSAASSVQGVGRDSGDRISAPGGWYDAGDYGKYTVNSGISTWTLLHLYEAEKAYFDTLSLDVPGHDGPSSDLVDEILWNLRWMLEMQDPYDGGVYHKLTSAQHAKEIMPADDAANRYVVAKSTAATLDMAAVAAYAARLFRDEDALPGFADSCLDAARYAWQWARQYPDSIYDQDQLNSDYNPDIKTGEYGDASVADEFDWAAAELFLTTAEDSFATATGLNTQIPNIKVFGVPNWSSVLTLGYLSLATHTDLLSGSLDGTSDVLLAALDSTARSVAIVRSGSAYHLPRGSYVWGGTSTFANGAMLALDGWRVNGDTAYFHAAVEALDYILGRNATGYSLVTGFGDNPAMYPHHRPSIADGVTDPVPGFMVGGPNASAAATDGCDYPVEYGPMEYLDDADCYASNEVTINWNAPLAFVSGVVSAFLEGDTTTIAVTARAARAASALRLSSLSGVLTVGLAGGDLRSAELFSPSGRLLARAEGSGASITVPVAAHGLVLVRARTAAGQWLSARHVLP